MKYGLRSLTVNEIGDLFKYNQGYLLARAILEFLLNLNDLKPQAPQADPRGLLLA